MPFEIRLPRAVLLFLFLTGCGSANNSCIGLEGNLETVSQCAQDEECDVILKVEQGRAFCRAGICQLKSQEKPGNTLDANPVVDPPMDAGESDALVGDGATDVSDAGADAQDAALD